MRELYLRELYLRELYLYDVDPEYLKFLHKIDKRVSVKFNTRPFVVIVLMLNHTPYLVPLTSQTTQEREKAGKKKRSSKITTFIRDSRGNEIANLLYNNMIPISKENCTLRIINPKYDTYELNEIRFIRKNKVEITSKAQSVHDRRVLGTDSFLNKMCCDFALLEVKYKEYIKRPGRV